VVYLGYPSETYYIEFNCSGILTFGANGSGRMGSGLIYRLIVIRVFIRVFVTFYLVVCF
jgi:hypothetical protein